MRIRKKYADMALIFLYTLVSTLGLLAIGAIL